MLQTPVKPMCTDANDVEFDANLQALILMMKVGFTILITNAVIPLSAFKYVPHANFKLLCNRAST